MFTFGILTTHFPYIAFMVFYAYFLLFGVEKASEGKVDFGMQIFKSELYASDLDMVSDNSTNLDYQDNFKFNTDLEKSIFHRKIKHSVLNSAYNPQSYFLYSLFSRPPPALS